MNFQALKRRARLIVPQLKPNVAPDPDVEELLNEGALEVARLTGCLKGNIKFASVADQKEYDVSTISGIQDDFLELDKPRILYRSSATANYLPLTPKTRKWLDEHVPNWLNNDSGTPLYYFEEDQKIIFDTAPDTAVSDAFWVFYIKQPPVMTQPAHFPFGGTI